MNPTAKATPTGTPMGGAIAANAIAPITPKDRDWTVPEAAMTAAAALLAPSAFALAKSSAVAAIWPGIENAALTPALPAADFVRAPKTSPFRSWANEIAFLAIPTAVGLPVGPVPVPPVPVP